MHLQVRQPTQVSDSVLSKCSPTTTQEQGKPALVQQQGEPAQIKGKKGREMQPSQVVERRFEDSGIMVVGQSKRHSSIVESVDCCSRLQEGQPLNHQWCTGGLCSLVYTTLPRMCIFCYFCSAHQGSQPLPWLSAEAEVGRIGWD